MTGGPTWVSRHEIAVVLGCRPDNVSRLARAGHLRSITNPARNGHHLYALEDAHARRDGRAERPPVETQAPPSVVEEREPGEGGPYYYDAGRDTYVFNLPSKPRHPWAVPGDVVRRVVTAYSNDGDGATWNQVAREMGWRRATVREMLRALGKTHDSLPFTREQLESADSDDALVDDVVALREERVHVKAERRSWAKTKEMADRWRDLERGVARLLSEMELPEARAMPRWKRDRLRRRGSLEPAPAFTLATHATDLHYGKRGWVHQCGEEYDREETRRRLLDATDRLIARTLRNGEPDRVVVAAGGDWFHVDGNTAATSRGTPQDVDGLPLEVWNGGAQLAIDQIERLREPFAVVHVREVPGNHDWWSTFMLFRFLWAYYRNTPDVVVDVGGVDRQYERIGDTILGWTHGDKVRDQNLGRLMSVEAKDHWSDTRHRLFLTGHWHSQRVSEEYGVVVDHLPSLAGTDRWHKAHGYVGNRKALVGYLIDHVEGPVAKLFADPSL